MGAMQYFSEVSCSVSKLTLFSSHGIKESHKFLTKSLRSESVQSVMSSNPQLSCTVSRI